MINLKACARCGGDLIPEELLGDIDLVCLQCGHRIAAPSSPKVTYRIRPARRPETAERPRKRAA